MIWFGSIPFRQNPQTGPQNKSVDASSPLIRVAGSGYFTCRLISSGSSFNCYALKRLVSECQQQPVKQRVLGGSRQSNMTSKAVVTSNHQSYCQMGLQICSRRVSSTTQITGPKQVITQRSKSRRDHAIVGPQFPSQNHLARRTSSAVAKVQYHCSPKRSPHMRVITIRINPRFSVVASEGEVAKMATSSVNANAMIALYM